MKRNGILILAVGLIFALVAFGALPKPTLVIAGDSVGRIIDKTGVEQLAALGRSFDVQNLSVDGRTLKTAFKDVQGLEAKPDIVLVFSGFCDRHMQGVGGEKLVAGAQALVPLTDGGLVIWVDTDKLPEDWTWDGTHPHIEGFRNVFRHVDPILFCGDCRRGNACQKHRHPEPWLWSFN